MMKIRRNRWTHAVSVLAVMAGMTAASPAATRKTSFGSMPDGRAVALFTVSTPKLELAVTEFGARVVSIRVPDRDGTMANVALGYGDVQGYIADKSTYFGAIVGRYGNRIAKGEFSLDGKPYQVPVNNIGNALHGGPVGFDQLLWKGSAIPDGVQMELVSPDGDMGFPGTLTVKVRYTVHNGAIRIDYTATTDKTTVLNLTNHTYFNLSGEGQGDILGEVLQLKASHYTPVDATLIPTGELAPVEGTPFDFRTPTAVGLRIGDDNSQLKIPGGYDHNFVVDGAAGTLREAAQLYDPKSGRVLTVSTTEPGVQVYSGNFLDGTMHDPAGTPYRKNSALCLETQHYPDSPNHPAFPGTTLKPGKIWHSTTVFAFSARM